MVRRKAFSLNPSRGRTPRVTQQFSKNAGLSSSVLFPSQCRGSACIHRPCRYTRLSEFTITTTNLIRHRLELCFDNNHMRMDLSASERAPAESVEGALEQVEVNVLDDHCA